MKKNIIATFLLAGAALASQGAEPVECGNRPFYGFFLSNPGGYTNASEESYGFSRQTFSNPGSNELIYGLSGGVGLYAATAVDGIYYAVPYLYESSMSMPKPRPLFTYNIYTGQVIELGEWGGATDLKPSDMTYDRKNDRILAICYGSSEGSGIYEVNRKTGAMTLLRRNDNAGGVIAADAFGRVFTINHQGELVQIDMTRDNSSKVIYTLPYSFLSANQSLEFDLTNGKLYWASNTLDNPLGDKGTGTWLVEITLPGISPDMDYSADMQGYSYKSCGEIGKKARFLGMYIPYATGGFEAPGFAVDPKSQSSVNGDFCTISFEIPGTTFGGDAIASVDGYELYRDGERIYTDKHVYSAGERVSYQDKSVPVTGREYRYDIVCYSNTKGDGPKTPVFAYIGFDAPAAVSDAYAEVSDDFMSTTVSWTAPQAGMHGGTFDPGTTTYDVVRLPDNVKVAENIKECSVKDNLRRLLRYSYRITAKNAYGESSAQTPEFIAGTPVSEFPVEETFENPTAMALKWNTVDNNGDGMTWIYGTTLGQNVFGDYEMTAEYIISPTSVDVYTQDADDWIISPPINFDSGTKYNITFDIRSLTPETLNVYVGSKNVVEGMEFVKTFGLRKPEYADDADGRMLFQKYVVELPEHIAGTTACVAVQLATPLNDEYYSYIQLGNICIDDRTSGISGVTEDGASFSVKDGNLALNGDFSNAAIYSLCGMKVMDVKGGLTSLEGLRGIYILAIDGKSYKMAVR